jgi:transcription termination factor Rho
VADSRTSGEEQLREPEEMERVRALRQDLSQKSTEEAAQGLSDLIGDSANNAELLERF